MKKIFCLMIIGCLVISAGLFSFVPSTSAAASVSYTLYIDGKIMSSKYPIVMEGNTTLIPMKAVLTELKYTTVVDNKTKAITAKNSAGSFISVKAGSKKAKINGSDTLLQASVKAMNGTTYIPLSIIKDLTGKSIGIDKASGIAWIGDKPTDPTPFPAWGVTPDQVKTASGQKPLIDEGGKGDIYLLLYQGSNEVSEEVYMFYKNELAKATFTPDTTSLDEIGLLGCYSGMYNTIVRAYGQPTKGAVSLNKDTVDQYLTVLSNEGYLSSEWQVADTKIKILLKATDTDYTVNMQYINASVEDQLNAALNALK